MVTQQPGRSGVGRRLTAGSVCRWWRSRPTRRTRPARKAWRGLRRPSCEAGGTQRLGRNHRQFAQPQGIQKERVPAVIQSPHPTFLPNCWLGLRKMQEASAALDFSVLQRIGHDCPAAAARSGFPEIANSCRVIEALAQALDVDGLADAIERFANTLLAASNAGARWVAAGAGLPQAMRTEPQS